MPPADTYQYLLATVTAAMRELPAVEARLLAGEITDLVNRQMAGNAYAQGSIASTLLPPALRNVTTLSIGWDAYEVLHGSRTSGLHTRTTTSVLCTLPASYRNTAKVREMAERTGIWPGSLMLALYELIQDAEQELVIMTPYWSTLGVEELLRHVTRDSMRGVRVWIMTQPSTNLAFDALLAVNELRSSLASRSARVTVHSPHDENGQVPLLHAKVLVRDGIEAYVGSANVSAAGVEHSFELGVRLHGSAAQGVKAWVDVLVERFETWRADPE
jgi:phosphatidylserine/phosphatidylglycerophosphate/cardiolipin synthase-like enzyme